MSLFFPYRSGDNEIITAYITYIALTQERRGKETAIARASEDIRRANWSETPSCDYGLRPFAD